MTTFIILLMAWVQPLPLESKIYSINGNFTIGKMGVNCLGRGLCSFDAIYEPGESYNAEIVRENLYDLKIILFLDRLNTSDFFKLTGMSFEAFEERRIQQIRIQSSFLLDETTREDLHLPLEYKSIDLLDTKAMINGYKLIIALKI